MSDAPKKNLTIGILGAANISKKNCRAASHPSTSCTIAAIASRSEQKAQDFVSEIFATIPSTPTVYGGETAYSTLINSPCDALYIPLPSKLHYEHVIPALESGKHVLLEKPVANSAQEYRAMLQTASQNKKLLMDGTMFVHHPRTKAFITSVTNPTRVHFNFTFDGGANFHRNDIRVKKDGDFMGCIGDLGWYCVRMGLLVFSGGDDGRLNGLVTDVQVMRYRLNEEGVPLEAECMVHFTEDRILSFHCSFMHPLNQTVQISGHGCKHTAVMTDAILPFKGEKLTYSLVKQGMYQYAEIIEPKSEVVEFDNSLVQEVCMWRNFNEWIEAIKQESSSSEAKAGDCKWWSGNSDGVKEANSIASFSLYAQMVLDGLMESVRSSSSKVKIPDLI